MSLSNDYYGSVWLKYYGPWDAIGGKKNRNPGKYYGYSKDDILKNCRVDLSFSQGCLICLGEIKKDSKRIMHAQNMSLEGNCWVKDLIAKRSLRTRSLNLNIKILNWTLIRGKLKYLNSLKFWTKSKHSYHNNYTPEQF
jgi:hypothetical protein